MVSLAQIAIAGVAVALLFRAGSTKLMRLSEFAVTLRILGFGRRAALIGAAVVSVCEASVWLILLAGQYALAAALVAALGMSFASAGLWVIRRGLDVPCACFGSAFNERLGWHQVFAFPGWLLASSAIASLPESAFHTRLESAVSIIVLLTTLRAVMCVRGHQSARQDRHAFAGGGR
jgi:hypothetical protein